MVPVKSAQRVLQILEFFDEVRKPATIVMIAEALRYPHSSTTALLRSLVAMGYLRYDPKSRLYQPTERIPLLGSWVSPLLVQTGTVQHLLTELCEVTGRGAILVASNQKNVQCIYALHHNESESAIMKVGQEEAIFQSPFGPLFLAAHTDAEIKTTLRSFNAYLPSDRRIEPGNILPTVHDVRRQDYIVARKQEWDFIGKRLPHFCAARPLALGLICDPQSVDWSSISRLIDREIGKWLQPQTNEVLIPDPQTSRPSHRHHRYYVAEAAEVA